MKYSYVVVSADLYLSEGRVCVRWAYGIEGTLPDFVKLNVLQNY